MSFQNQHQFQAYLNSRKTTQKKEKRRISTTSSASKQNYSVSSANKTINYNENNPISTTKITSFKQQFTDSRRISQNSTNKKTIQFKNPQKIIENLGKKISVSGKPENKINSLNLTNLKGFTKAPITSIRDDLRSNILDNYQILPGPPVDFMVKTDEPEMQNLFTNNIRFRRRYVRSNSNSRSSNSSTGSFLEQQSRRLNNLIFKNKMVVKDNDDIGEGQLKKKRHHGSFHRRKGEEKGKFQNAFKVKGNNLMFLSPQHREYSREKQNNFKELFGNNNDNRHLNITVDNNNPYFNDNTREEENSLGRRTFPRENAGSKVEEIRMDQSIHSRPSNTSRSSLTESHNKAFQFESFHPIIAPPTTILLPQNTERNPPKPQGGIPPSPKPIPGGRVENPQILMAPPGPSGFAQRQSLPGQNQSNNGAQIPQSIPQEGVMGMSQQEQQEIQQIEQSINEEAPPAKLPILPEGPPVPPPQNPSEETKAFLQFLAVRHQNEVHNICNQSNDNIKNLHTDIKKIQLQLKISHNSLRAKDRHITDLKNQINAMAGQFQRAESMKNDEIQRLIHELNALKGGLHPQNNTLKIDDRSVLAKENMDLKAQIASFQILKHQDVKEFEFLNKRLVEQIEKLREKKEKVKSENKLLRKENRALVDTINYLDRENVNLKNINKFYKESFYPGEGEEANKTPPQNDINPGKDKIRRLPSEMVDEDGGGNFSKMKFTLDTEGMLSPHFNKKYPYSIEKQPPSNKNSFSPLKDRTSLNFKFGSFVPLEAENVKKDLQKTGTFGLKLNSNRSKNAKSADIKTIYINNSGGNLKEEEEEEIKNESEEGEMNYQLESSVQFPNLNNNAMFNSNANPYFSTIAPNKVTSELGSQRGTLNPGFETEFYQEDIKTMKNEIERLKIENQRILQSGQLNNKMILKEAVEFLMKIQSLDSQNEREKYLSQYLENFSKNPVEENQRNPMEMAQLRVPTTMMQVFQDTSTTYENSGRKEHLYNSDLTHNKNNNNKSNELEFSTKYGVNLKPSTIKEVDEDMSNYGSLQDKNRESLRQPNNEKQDIVSPVDTFSRKITYNSDSKKIQLNF